MEWQSTLRSLCLPDEPLKNLLFTAAIPGTLMQCVGAARENARQVREVITEEMWLRVNEAHWSLSEASSRATDEAAFVRVLQGLLGSCSIFDGIADTAMNRGEGWPFLRLGKWLEREDRLARCLSARLDRPPVPAQSAHEKVGYVALLRSAGALEAYRQRGSNRVDQRGVLEFLACYRDFPGSLCFGATASLALARRLSARKDQDRSLERAVGRLAALLEHGEVAELLAVGPTAFATQALESTRAASAILQKTYFLD